MIKRIELVLAEVVNHLAIGVVHARARDVTLQVMVGIEDREPVGLGTLKGLHDLVHGGVVIQDVGWFDHQLAGSEMVIKLGAEHDMAYLQDIDLAQQVAGSIGHREHTIARTADFMNQSVETLSMTVKRPCG